MAMITEDTNPPPLLAPYLPALNVGYGDDAFGDACGKMTYKKTIAKPEIKK